MQPTTATAPGTPAATHTWLHAWQQQHAQQQQQTLWRHMQRSWQQQRQVAAVVRPRRRTHMLLS
jgi:hypothetical protein